jgi:hypothetical protein
MATNQRNLTISAFHASPYDDISIFRPLTHFGPRDAAVERAAARKFDDQEMTLYEVELNIENPLEIYDEGGSHTVEYLVSAIRGADRKAMNRFASDAILTKAEEEGEAAGMSLLLEVMVGRGQYDGLVYENNTEGRDSLSWVIFHPDRVRIIGKETLAMDARSAFR